MAGSSGWQDVPSTFKVGVGILAFNRPHYLAEMLSALVNQNHAEAFPIVVFDNGSSPSLESQVRMQLRGFPGPVTFMREHSNALNVDRVLRLVQAVDADFVVLPGDDDVPLPNFMKTLQELSSAGPDVTIVSGAMGQIDHRGRRLATVNCPPVFDNAQGALAALLERASYSMPATAFRKSIIDPTFLPRTRTAFDWWLWIQGWMRGVAVVSQEEIVLYRQHEGQEQRHYGSHVFRADAARMLISVLTSPSFKKRLDEWSPTEVDHFAGAALSSEGPNSGDSRWGPMVQMVLADRLLGVASSERICGLFAQASAQAGSPPTLGALRALVGDPDLAELPKETWSRVPVTISFIGACRHIQAWKSFLNWHPARSSQIEVALWCSCDQETTAQGSVFARGCRGDTDESFEMRLSEGPGEVATAQLLDAIGLLTGRLHGFEMHDDGAARFLKFYEKLRLSRAGALLESGYRRYSKLGSRARAHRLGRAKG